MADIVNLRRARKQAKRRRTEQEAVRNRLAHGRSKAERVIEQSNEKRINGILDQHRLDSGDK